MVANLCLFACALLPLQAVDRTEWLLTPRLGRGQELVYRGTFTEEALGKGVHFSRSYRLETRVFVLDTPPRGLDVAFYSILHMRAPGLEHTAATEPSSVRLE